MEIFLYGMLIAFLTILLIGFPYFFHWWKSKHIEKLNSQTFKEFVESEHLHLDILESWRNHYILGIDSTKNILVYARQGQFPTVTSIDLDDVDHLRIDAHYIHSGMFKKPSKKLDYLDLVLYFKDSRRLPKSIPIFDKQEVPYLTDEIAIANNWMKNIFSRLKPNPINAEPVKMAF